jgi:hypothetical protein
MGNELTKALEELRRAIRDKGPHPEFHDQARIMVSKTWPTLWTAIGRVLLAYERGEAQDE